MRRPARIARRRGDGFGGGHGFFHRRRIERRADENFRRLLRPQRRLGDIGQPDRATRDLAAAHGQHHGRGGGGVIADLALELFVSRAVTGRRHRDAHRGEHVARFQRGEIGALVKFARGDAPFAAFAGDVIGGVKAQHHRRHVVAGIAVGDIAAERADIAHLRIGDLQRGLAQQRDFCCRADRSRSHRAGSSWRR